MTETYGLTTLNRATQMLAEVRTIDDAKHIIDLAEAARVYAREVELGLEAQNHAAEIKLRAQRKAGEILDQMEKRDGGQAMKARSHLATEVLPPTLADLGISKSDSSRWQTIASIPEPEFEQHIQETKIEDKELTTSGLLKIAKEEKRKAELEKQREDIATGKATLPDGVFEVLVIDPPWQYGTEYDPDGRRAANPYPEMGLDEIKALKLPAADNCILWLWTTHKFMRYSFDLLDAWGFRDVAILTWEKDRMGLGSWLRSKSEFCIMAVKGKPKVYLTNQTTVIHGAMREHSRKPDEFYEMVDSLCVGRKLDYFSREKRPGWECFGNDTERFGVELLAI